MGYRYIGAKSRLLGEILPVIKEQTPAGGRVVDLMCGTSAVSAALRQAGFQVIANDLMTYSFHHARVSLLFTSSPAFKKAGDFIEAHSSARSDSLFPLTSYERILRGLEKSPPLKGYFWREFSQEGSPAAGVRPRNYYSPVNAKKIDGIRQQIRQLAADGLITELEHSLLLHDLIMAANDSANIAGTYGHYMAKISGRARDAIRLLPTQVLVLPDKGRHQVLQGYAEELAPKIQADLCYIDPPYMKRQYAANYHLLETLAREDEPEAIGVSGLRPWRDQYSNFCTKTKIRDSFSRIFTNMKCQRFLISYSEDGLVPLKDMQKFLAEFGHVKTQTIRNKRFKSNNSELAPVITEYLFHLETS